MIDRIALLTFVVVTASTIGCRQSTAPSRPKNPRDFVWTASHIGTTAVPSPVLWSICGSSSTNLYACGYTYTDRKSVIFHYNGNDWSPEDLGGITNNMSQLRRMTAFAPNDIWAVGARVYLDTLEHDSSLVVHFDGIAWTSVLASHMGVANLLCIWGTGSNNLYCGSGDGKILHYDGVHWDIDTVRNKFSFNSLGGDQATLFAAGNDYSGSSQNPIVCFKKVGTSWSVAQTFAGGDFLTSIVSLGSGNYFATSWGVLQWQSGQWIYVCPLQAYMSEVAGTSPDNILAVGGNYPDEEIQHWNGRDWSPTPRAHGLIPVGGGPRSVWLDNNDAFIVTNDFKTSYVLHGK